MPEIACFSVSYCARNVSASVRASCNSFCNAFKRSCEASSSSCFKAVSSISSCITFRDAASSSEGWESISVRNIAHASSTRSIALSGRNLFVMYLFESTAADTSALSRITTPWCTCNFSLIPRKIDMVSSTVGCSTSTGWNLRASAASFSMYFLYSSTVVAPMQWSSPRASMGFNMFPASTAPSAAPAPTIVWSSSMNNIILPSLFFISLSTAFKRSSNSPRYFAPATSDPISSANTVLSFSPSGTSPRTIRCASPSTIAVFPTPGSPINTGLFFVLRDNMRTTRRISSSRPITGSSLLFRAASTRSLPYFSRASYVASGSALWTLCEPRTSFNIRKNFSSVMPYCLKTFPPSEIIANIKCSTETYSSLRIFARSSAKFITLFSLLVRYIFPCSTPLPVTRGSFAISSSTDFASDDVFMSMRFRSCAINPPESFSSASSKCSTSTLWWLYSLAIFCACISASWLLFVSLFIPFTP